MFKQRLNGLKKIIKDRGLDAILISNFYNILYLSGFKTLTENEREAWLLITTKNIYLFSDNRYINDVTKLSNELLKFRLLKPEKGLLSHLQNIVDEEKIEKVAIESDDLKLLEFKQLADYLNTVKLVAVEKLIVELRKIKDELEIEKVKKSCEISDKCLTEIINTIRVGQTEKEIAFKIEFWLKEKFYDMAFYPIVSFDENSALIHYDTRTGNNKKIKNGSIVLIDFGAKVNDYLSDITRMVFIGKPSEDILKKYNQLLMFQERAIGLTKNGTIAKEVDLICRNEFGFPHATGHGVGLEIHEFPKISPVANEKLLTNEIVTIEPGIYRQGEWGMRIEDTILVKEKRAEVLTKFGKQPLIINV